MTSKELMTGVFSGKRTNRIPFAPAIYEHKAYLLDRTPSEVARDENLLVEAIMKEYSTYRPDLLTVGLDVYNVEPEVLGCEIKYYSNSNDVPVIKGKLVKSRKDIGELATPDPISDGRMGLTIGAGRKVMEELGGEVYVRGAVSGPFTLGCNLAGQQRVIIEAYKNSRFVHDLLRFSTRIIKEYSSGWIDSGLDVIVFDSLSSPPLISPEIYRNVVKPYHEELFTHLGRFNLSHMPLIIGGNTTDIACDLAETGADLLLCDYNADLETYLNVAKKMDLSVRANLNPDKIRKESAQELYRLASDLVARGHRLNRFILGTGVLVYDTPVENVLAIKDASDRPQNDKENDIE